MRRLTPAEIASALRGAGFQDGEIPRMTAIALAESGGDPRAHNPNASTGDNSYGLWQVNMLGEMGPERRKKLGLKANEELFDPVTNARAAKQIYDSQGLNAWSVYRSKDYEKYLPQARQALQNLSSGQAPRPRPFAAPEPLPEPQEASDGFTRNMIASILGGGAGASAAGAGSPLNLRNTLGLGSGAGGGPELLPTTEGAVPLLGGLGGAGVFASLARAIRGGKTSGAGQRMAGKGPFTGLMNAILNPDMDAPPPSPLVAVPPAAEVRTGSGPSIKGYRQGGWGPKGATQYGDHFDIAAIDGSHFERGALDDYVLVNGKPLSRTVTVSGGQFGASRDGGKRVHRAWDFADEPGALLTLRPGSGAVWLSNRSSDYGDRAEFQVPDGRRFRIIHGMAVPEG